jgi:predicted phage baseplate assembly protein
MPLDQQEPTFDRPFEEIYRELRSRIPRYNPAWTNFNDSDPGITLLQLFSWLAEMTYHRMGQMPRKNYLKFAELLGLQLSPARPATVRLTFTPKPSEPPSTIHRGSRYSAQVEGAPAPLAFETEDDLDVIGAPLAARLVFADGTITPPIDEPTIPPTQVFYPFGRNPEPGDALYLGFKPNPNNPKPFPLKMRFLALLPAADTNGVPQRVGDQDQSLIAPVDLVWEYRAKAAQDDWERLNVFNDQTAAFTRDGYIDVEGPRDIEPSVDPVVQARVNAPHYWLRVRLDQNRYPTGRAPRLEYFLPNSVDAVNLTTEDEYLFGTSSGRAEQSFDFPSRPVDPDSLRVEVRNNGVATPWIRVDDFFHSGQADLHFVLDETAGRITFGDGEYGQIPPAGADIAATRWRHGGGQIGNRVAAGSVKTMITQVVGIDKVTNFRAATGGSDEETIDAFIKNAPAQLRSGDRAVTADDFESMARRVGGVKKAKALGGMHPDFPDVTVPGSVTVLIVPDSDASPPEPSAELIRSVCARLEGVRLITTEVYVAAPRFIEVRIEARLFAAPQASFDAVAEDARNRLNDYLSPVSRDFGEDISPAAIYAELFGAVGTSQVRSVEDLIVYVDGNVHKEGKPIDVPPDALVYSGDHLIVVRPAQDVRAR